MIHGVHLINFANHQDTRLSLSRLAALVGENGAGKTKIMRAVEQVSKLLPQPKTIDEFVPESPSVPIPREFLRIGSADMWIGISGSGMRNGVPGQRGIRATTSMPAIRTRGCSESHLVILRFAEENRTL